MSADLNGSYNFELYVQFCSDLFIDDDDLPIKTSSSCHFAHIWSILEYRIKSFGYLNQLDYGRIYLIHTCQKVV